MRELFQGAQQSVLIAGFRFDHAGTILEPLHRAMVERGVRVGIYVDIEGHSPSQVGARAFAVRYVERFLARNWPFGEPRPEIFYDPRTAAPRSWVSLHAKCVVVDAERALVTSANFTDRGQTRNIEVGVLLEHRSFATGLVAQWRGLVEAGVLAKYVGM